MMRLCVPLLALVLVACEAVTNPLCSCSPPQAGAELMGTIRSATGVAVSGFRVRAERSYGACAEFDRNPTSTVSAPDGRYSITIAAGWADSVCVRLFARDTTPGAEEVALSVSPRVLLRWWPYDTTALDLALPP